MMPAPDSQTRNDTVIGPGTKIDNLVQIGHNVQVGALCLIMSQVGIAGSAGDGSSSSSVRSGSLPRGAAIKVLVTLHLKA